MKILENLIGATLPLGLAAIVLVSTGMDELIPLAAIVALIWALVVTTHPQQEV